MELPKKEDYSKIKGQKLHKLYHIIKYLMKETWKKSQINSLKYYESK